MAASCASPGTALPPAEIERAYAAADGFGDCAGVYFAMAEFLDGAEAPAVARHVEELGHGAYAGGAHVLHDTGAVERWSHALSHVGDRSAAEKRKWDALIALSFAEQTYEGEAQTMIQSALDYCNSLTKTEVFLIQDINKSRLR